MLHKTTMEGLPVTISEVMAKRWEEYERRKFILWERAKREAWSYEQYRQAVRELLDELKL